MIEYDQLEVIFFHKPGSDKEKTLNELRAAVHPTFTLEERGFAVDGPLSNCRQIIRFRTNGAFASVQNLENCVRELASGETFPWQRMGAVLVGHTEMLRC